MNTWALSGERAINAIKKCVPGGGFPTNDDDDDGLPELLGGISVNDDDDGHPELEDISANDDDDGLPDLEDISVDDDDDALPGGIRRNGIPGYWPYALLVGAVILPNFSFDCWNASSGERILSCRRNVCPDDVKKAAENIARDYAEFELRRLQENIALVDGLWEDGLGDMHDSFEMEEVD
jgi:hypothetical protein